MHPFSTDSPERDRLRLVLFVISIALAWTTHVALSVLNLEIPWWLDAPSVIFFYGILFYLLDNHLWRTPLVHRVGLIRIPDLNGTWTGEVDSSYEAAADEKPINAIVKVRQSWTKIIVVLETDRSRSVSELAMVLTARPEPVLSYEYRNEPNARATESMHAHRGTAALTFENETLFGDYYSGRDRRNHGMLRLRRSVGRRTAQV